MYVVAYVSTQRTLMKIPTYYVHIKYYIQVPGYLSMLHGVCRRTRIQKWSDRMSKIGKDQSPRFWVLGPDMIKDVGCPIKMMGTRWLFDDEYLSIQQ